MVCINVIITSYIGVPLMHSQFGEWLNLDRPQPQPLVRDCSVGYMWGLVTNALDAGFSQGMRVALLLIYVAINILCGIFVGSG
jgi:hypothetical protein